MIRSWNGRPSIALPYRPLLLRLVVGLTVHPRLLMLGWSFPITQAAATGEVNNESAVQTVADIERKLRGQEKSFVTLSVEGQVHSQIMEAISQENLSKMYIGWAPWM